MNGTVLWIILAVVAAGTLAALAPLVLQGWRLYRTVRRARGELLPLVDGLTQRADAAAGKAAAMGARGQALSDSIASLQGSVGRVSVLVRALQEAGDRWSRVRRFVG